MKMKGTKLFAMEWGKIIRSPKVLISVIAVMLVPLMYSGLFLGTFWDPYERLTDLPVAIVNQDKGAEFEGKSLTAGKELVDELQERKDFDFSFVSEAEAMDGLENDKYYMMITIPENFSEQATTLLDDKPAPAQLIFKTNEGHNFLAAQIGGTAIEKVNSEISKKVTEAYTEIMFEQVEKISDGLKEAGDGATKLYDGTTELADGASKLKENMAKLADGAVQLKDGTAPLQAGVSKLTDGVSGLQAGAKSLSSGMDQLAQAEKQLEQGATASKAGANQLKQGLQQSSDASAELAQGAAALANGLNQLVQANPAMAEDPGVKQLLGASQAVMQGTKKLSEGQQQLVQGASQLTQGQEQLTAGMKQFGEKLNEAKAGSHQLADGSTQLLNGVKGLQGGVGQALGALDQLASGATQLDEGTGTLQDGIGKLQDGSNELASKLNEAADKSSEVKGNDDRISMFAGPVEVVESSINEVPNYGTGFAPYFLSLGLFVGALILTIVLPLVQSPDPTANGWSRFFSKTLLFVSVGVVQALLADWIMIQGLGLEVKDMGAFVGFSVLTSVTFMMIIQSLVTVFENPGRFMAIVLLIMQLVTCGGTFPMELTPKAMQAIGPWLPMTYTVNGFKAVISSGDISRMWSEVGMMAIYMVAFGALTLGFFIVRSRKDKANTAAPGEVLSSM